MLSTTKEENYPKMTKKSLRAICKKHEQYLTPELNDILYLHFQGFSKIENLDEYTGLKCLWLESNGISKIENLCNLTGLKCLYLQQNLIEEIENLEKLTELDTLNLANNSLTKIQNLSVLSKLHTLQLSHNYFKSADDIMELKLCVNIGILDLQHNRIDDPSVVDIFSQMPRLGVLTVQGNPFINKIKYYRKNMICAISSLKYLDDRPVFDKDRSAALAWQRGGLKAEQEDRKKWAKMEQDRILASVDALRNIRARNICIQGTTQSDNGDISDNDSDTNGEMECQETPRVLSLNNPIGDNTEYHVVPPDPLPDTSEPFLITELPSENSIEEIDLTQTCKPNCSIFGDNSSNLAPNNPLMFDFDQSNAKSASKVPKRPFLIEECDDEISQTFHSSDPVAEVETDSNSVQIGTKKLITEIDSDTELIPTHSSDFMEHFNDLKGVNIVTTALDENEIVTMETQECNDPHPYTTPPHEVIQNLAELIGTTSGTGTIDTEL
ncbi:Dynein assembly factor 1, axonemal [Oopsacas minuta]|uniref:Dynein assembly factor 1, axonemal n=1 Tax=Oopsacas minuta TaxID=111878 RepID=A0AAV7K0Q4_9METZ|nr:Dynein assembly factor 1, axonemal [Oopsacas minuta]